jgi:predicted lipase
MAYVKLDLEIHKKSDILLHYSPLNDLYQSPFLVSVDHDWNTIVIAIRGTYSASDILVDLNLETEILDLDLESPELYKVHSGFYKSALNIVKDILENQVLEKNLKGKSVRESSYQIVVCGHSLGAVKIFC